jgi:hypothetical protein
MSNTHGGYRDRAGRPKGAKNKRTLDVEATINSFGCPFEGMARVATKAEENGDLATAGRLYAELGRYLAPHRKAVEIDDKKQREPIGTLEELRVMKEAILSGKVTTIR